MKKTSKKMNNMIENKHKYDYNNSYELQVRQSNGKPNFDKMKDLNIA